jgi:hypothetical protein
MTSKGRAVAVKEAEIKAASPGTVINVALGSTALESERRRKSAP